MRTFPDPIAAAPRRSRSGDGAAATADQRLVMFQSAVMPVIGTIPEMRSDR
jgi:hypothetical protein